MREQLSAIFTSNKLVLWQNGSMRRREIPEIKVPCPTEAGQAGTHSVSAKKLKVKKMRVRVTKQNKN